MAQSMSIQDEDNDLSFMLQPCPVDIPQSYEYIGKKYFVRDCYEEYYEKIMDLLFPKEGQVEYRYITVTGTPGIGKSIFYMYFLNRYRQEYPDKSVVCAAYSKDRKLEKSVLYGKQNEEPKKLLNPINSFYIPIAETSSKWNCDLYLYDGPPELKPADVKMIAFTSPNITWLSSMIKNPRHVRLYMPVWTHDELSDAVCALDLGISEQELCERVMYFGGSARYCLSTDDNFVDVGRETTKESLNKVSLDYIMKAIDSEQDLQKTVHLLMHYTPTKNGRYAQLAPASVKINDMLVERFVKHLNTQREKLMYWLDGIGKAGVLNGWLFENCSHEELSNGVSITIRSLDGNSPLQVTIDQTVGNYERFSKSTKTFELIPGIYQIPTNSNQPAIDSFYMTKDCIYLFQITLNEKHSIDVVGLFKFLTQVNLLDEVKKTPTYARLVFVVPMKMAEGYKKQSFKGKYADGPVGASQVDKLHRIGPVKKRKLSDMNICTVDELLTEYDRAENKNKFNFVRQAIETHRSVVKEISEENFLNDIPQYVMGIDVENKL